MNHKLWPPNGNLAQFILAQFPAGYRGWGVDVGASDGISINTTYALEKSHRWNILSVEPNPDFAPMLKQHRAFVEMCACDDHGGLSEFHIHQENPEAYSALRRPKRTPGTEPGEKMTWKTIMVPVSTVNQLLTKWEFPMLDLLCVDTEGTELQVLNGCDLEKWHPKVVVTECWDKVGPIDTFMESEGYKKIARNVHNDVWVRNGA